MEINNINEVFITTWLLFCLTSTLNADQLHIESVGKGFSVLRVHSQQSLLAVTGSSGLGASDHMTAVTANQQSKDRKSYLLAYRSL